MNKVSKDPLQRDDEEPKCVQIPYPPYYRRMLKDEKHRDESDKANVGSVMTPAVSWNHDRIPSLHKKKMEDSTRGNFFLTDKAMYTAVAPYSTPRGWSSPVVSPWGWNYNSTRGHTARSPPPSTLPLIENEPLRRPRPRHPHSRHHNHPVSFGSNTGKGTNDTKKGVRTVCPSLRDSGGDGGHARPRLESQSTFTPFLHYGSSADRPATSPRGTCTCFLSRDASYLKNLLFVDYVRDLFLVLPLHKENALYEEEAEADRKKRREEENMRFEINSTKHGDILEKDVLEGRRYWKQDNPVVIPHPQPSAIIDRREKEEVRKFRLYSDKYRDLVLKASEVETNEDEGGEGEGTLLRLWLALKEEQKKPIQKRKFYLEGPVDWIKVLGEQQEAIQN